MSGYRFKQGTWISVACLVLAGSSAMAQGGSGQQSLAGTLGIYVFPTQGQTPEQQSKDEASCYQWAVSNTGSDPFDVQKQMSADAQQAAAAQQQASQAGKGSGARGAVGGAAAGALIGEIADDDAGKGAAYGAAAGLVVGRRKAKREQRHAEEQIQAQAQQAEQVGESQLDAFKKAFSACMEGHNYISKF